MRDRVVAVAVASAVAGCGDDPIEVRARAGADYNRGELLVAVERFVADGRTPEAYGVLAREVTALRPGMDSTVAELAELELVSLALAPVEAMQGAPRPERTARLATTVWPVALAPAFETLAPDGWRDPTEAEVALRPGEPAADYVRRLCDTRYAVDCRHVVPEWQGSILNAEAIARLTSRTRAAIATCEECAGDAAWGETLARWEALDREAAVDRAYCEEIGKLARWPVAGAGAAAWVAAAEAEPLVLVAVEPDGDWLLDDAPIVADRRVDVLRDRRGGGEVLGVHLDPATRVATLEDVVRVAAEAGYREVRLQAREEAYPWAVVGYRIPVPAPAPVKRRARRPPPPVVVRLGRPSDSVQVFVRALDLAASRPAAQ